MDDRRAHFIGLVGDICVAAELAAIEIEILAGAGARVSGVPGSVRAADPEHQVDDTGYARTFRIDDHIVGLDDVLECTVRDPTRGKHDSPRRPR